MRRSPRPQPLPEACEQCTSLGRGANPTRNASPGAVRTFEGSFIELSWFLGLGETLENDLMEPESLESLLRQYQNVLEVKKYLRYKLAEHGLKNTDQIEEALAELEYT